MDTHLGIRLCTRLDGDGLLALYERNLDLSTKSGGREVDEQVVDEGIFLTDEVWMWLLLDHDVEIASRATHLAGMSITAHIKLHAVSHTSRDLDIYDLFAEDDTLAVAMCTLVLDLLACAVAIRTDGLGLHSAEKAINDLNHTTSALTLRTGIVIIAILGSRTLTVFALDVFLDLDMLLDAIDDVSQADLDTDTDVRSALAGRFVIAREEGTEAATAAATSEEAVEDIEWIETGATAEATAHARIIETELVIALAFLWVTEHLIGLSTLLEFLLGGLVARILVRMIFDGELTIGSLDFVV